jgi:DNA-binding CsgD family transcriptional regulator
MRDLEPHVGQALELSPREGEVLRHLATGSTYLQTANLMEISRHTVDTYLRRIKAKTGAYSGAALTRLAIVVEMLGCDHCKEPVAIPSMNGPTPNATWPSVCQPTSCSRNSKRRTLVNRPKCYRE